MAKIFFSAYAIFIMVSMGAASSVVAEPKDAEDNIVKSTLNDPPYHF